MRPDNITLAIFEKFTAEELAQTAAAMAQAQGDLESVENEKKSSDSVFKERINTHAAQVSELAHKYNKGGETAQIGCTIRYDIPVAGKKSYVRMDSEETVEVHDMSTEEKQETFQFPLSTAAKVETTPAADEKPKPKAKPVPETQAAQPPAPTAITFKDIQAIAAHVAKLRNGDSRKSALTEMQKSIAEKLLARGKVIGPDGRLEEIDCAETAQKLATAWLSLAIEEAEKPPAKEEVTKICPYPGCILFSFHEGNHEFPPNEAPKKTDAAAPQAQPEKEKKTRRSKRGFAPPPDEPSSSDDAHDEPGVH